MTPNRSGHAQRRGEAPLLPPLTLWPALAYLAVFYLFPVLRVLAISLFDPTFTINHYRHLIDVPIYGAIILNTFQISLTVSLICLILAYPTAYILVMAPRHLSRILIVFVMVPFFTSVLVRNYAWIFLLGAHGVINSALIRLGLIASPLPLMFNRFGVLIGMVHILLPYTILVLFTVMQGIKRQLIMAAESLLASPFTAFRRVFVPLSLPGVGASFLLVFVLALAFFVTPAMLGGAHDVMIANIIANVTASLNWGFAAALATVLLAASLIVIVLTQYFFGGIGLLAGGRAATRLSPHWRGREGPILWRLDEIVSPLWRYIHPAVGGAVLAFLVVPVLLIVPLSLSSAAFFVFPPPGFSWQWYREYLTAPGWLDSTWHSFEIAVLTTALALSMAVPAALGISRSRSRTGAIAYFWILSPLIMPSIVVAVGAFYLLSAMRLTGTVLGVALGHTILALPLSILVLTAALRNFDPNLERAAISLGASPLRTTLRITLPILSTAMYTAAFFAFLQSFDELLIALFVSGIDARTLPKKMWESLQEIDPTIAAVSTVLITFTVVALLILSLVQRVGERRTAGMVGARALGLAPSGGEE